MTNWQFVLAYLAIGFMVASIVIKIQPGDCLEDAYSGFAFSALGWPIAVAVGLLYLPVMLISKWIKLLSGY